MASARRALERKAPSDLALSGDQSSADGDASGPPPCNLADATYQALSVNSANENRASFLTSPLEVRLQIYDILLVSRARRRRMVTRRKMIGLERDRNRFDRTLEPDIARTCKQVNHEANYVLYSQNKILIERPEKAIYFLQEMSPRNVQFLTTLRIWVTWLGDRLESWLAVFRLLAEQASGLREMHITFEANSESTRNLQQGGKERGLGDNVEFARGLAQIKCLRKLEIDGYYAKPWPQYLGEKMGVEVLAKCGFTGLDGNQLDEATMSYIHRQQLEKFRYYQKDTDNLVPQDT